MGAFLSGLFNQVGPRLQEQHDEALKLQNQKKEGEYNTYWNSMQAAATRLSQLKAKGQLSPDEEQEAQRLASQYAWSEQQLNKMTKGSKPLAEAFQKVGGFVKQVLSHPSPKGQLQPPQQPQAGAPQQQPAQPSVSARLQPPPQIEQPSMQSAMALAQTQTPEGTKAQQAEVDRQRRKAEGKSLNLEGRDLAEFIETGKLPTRPAATKAVPERWKLKDGTEVDVDYDPTTRQRFTAQGEDFDVPEGATRVAAKTSAARPTVIASDVVKLEDAKKLKGAGLPFLGSDGKELDLDKVPQGMVLQKIHYSDGRTLYEPRNINDKVVTVGNVRYAVSPLDVQHLPEGAGTALGTANVGSSGTHEVAAVDANGNPIAQPLASTRRPPTPGIPGRPSAAPAPSSAAPQSRAPSAAAPAAPPRASAAPVPAGSRPLSGMTPGQYEHVRSIVTPVREAATQLFGDPTQPDLKPLVSFANLADNPDSRQKLGKALKLTFDAFRNATGDSHVNASAGPVSLSAGGGVIQMIENAFGVPPKLAEQAAGIMQKAISDLTPEEREAYDATMSAFGTIVGLRSLTKASAAQASVSTIEREMPVIGVNTTDSRQFADQMQRLAEIVYNGTKGTPAFVWEQQTPGLLERIRKLPQEAQKLKKSKASPNGTLKAPGATEVKVWDEQSKTFKTVKQ